MIVIASLIFGVNPLEMIGALESGGPMTPPESRPATAPPDPRTTSSRPFSATPKTCGQPCSRRPGRATSRRGSSPQRDASACGFASAAAGPFYCAADRKLYLDTAFFGELARKFGAPGDFAQAYVIAHEVGHHVQNLTGTMAKVDRQMQQTNARGRNALSVSLELQADCYAGIWGHFAQRRNKLEVGDLEEGLRAAAAVGDDAIQKRAQGYVVPESFTHGTAEQRLRWFRTGLESGDIRRCSTFG